MEARKFLVIDFNADSGSLLVRTLIRKFPTARVELCGDVGTATGAVGAAKFAAIVLHRTEELSGVELIQTIRALDSDVPIVAVSGVDRTAESLTAGATAFLQYDAWLRIGSVVAEALGPPKIEEVYPTRGLA